MSDAPAQQKTHGRPPTHGHNSRVRVLKNRGLDAINGRTRAGKEAKRWKAWVMAQKGNGNSSPHLKNEIELATPKSERRELRESELLDVKRQESEMNLEHDPLRLLRETTTTRARRRNMRDFNTKREQTNMRANARQSHDAGIELLKIVELYKQFRPELDDKTALKLAILGHPDLGERYTGLPIRRGGGREVKNFLLNGVRFRT